MAYNHKKLGKIVAEVLESGGYVTIHKLSNKTVHFQTPEEALSFIDRAREAFKLEDRAIIVDYDDKASNTSYYSSTNEDMKIRLTSSFVKPSTVDEDKL